MEIARQTGRRMVITGGSGGLGLATALELAQAGAHVVLAVRDVAAGEQAAADLPGSVEVRRLDLADLESVRRFAADWTDTLDVLINNAGVANVPLRHTANGFELQFGTNHLGHFALTNLLLPHVTDRVVTVASTAHRSARLEQGDIADLATAAGRYSPSTAYARSKLANLLFTLELQRRLDATGSAVRAVAAHPGMAASGLNRHLGPVLSAVAATVGRVLQQSTTDGARPILAATVADLPGGSYVGPDGAGERRGSPTLVGRSRTASDPVLAAALWAESETLTGVRFPLPALTQMS